jgi:hypothetical protein
VKRGPSALVVALAALVLAGCGGSHRSSISLPCNPKPQGALCLKVFQDRGKATDVVAYLAASGSALTGKTWRLALTYGRAGISPTHPRHGSPPEETFCKDAHGNTVTTGNGCDDTLASAFASFGDFRGFRVPGSLPVPLCLREQVQVNGKWTAGPAKPAYWRS